MTNASATAGACYDVMAWTSYMECIDDALEVLRDHVASSSSHSSRRAAGGGGNENDDADADGDGRKEAGGGRGYHDPARTIAFETCGRTFRVSGAMAPGITHDHRALRTEANRVCKARILVGERAVCLLPGSYKLWTNHLNFLTGTLDRCRTLDVEYRTATTRSDDDRVPPYLYRSSSHYGRYRATVSAYERSLVRLHRMPSIWLRYAAFVATYDPERNPTTVRNIYDRALISLPAGQHERVWEDYLFWVTGILPGDGGVGGTDGDDGGGGGDGIGWTNVRRRGQHKVKYGFESPLVASWRRRGWDCRRLSSSTVPIETAMRILRRHANCFDTTYREDLSTLCMTRYGRYGEAASLLLQLLNNEQASGSGMTMGGNFLSPNGTTRHELWLRFADVCTAHPNEARVAGVDFNGIVRAVLRGRGGGSMIGGEEEAGALEAGTAVSRVWGSRFSTIRPRRPTTMTTGRGKEGRLHRRRSITA